MYKLQEKSINRSNVLQGIVYVAILAILWLVWVNSMETYESKNIDNKNEELSLYWIIEKRMLEEVDEDLNQKQEDDQILPY